MEELTRQFEQRVNRQFLWGYRTTALILGAFFVFLAAYRFIQPSFSVIPRELAWEALALAVFYLAIFLLAPRVRTAGRHVEDLGVLLVLGTVFNAVCLMVFLPRSIQTTSFMLVQLGSGMAFRSRLRFILVQVLNLLAWVALFLRVESNRSPEPWIFAIVSAVLVAIAFHLFVQHTYRQLGQQYFRSELLLRQRERLIRSLRQSLSNIRTLRGFIPICAHCKKVRDDEGFWHAVEHYLKEHSDAEFTHGICPQCSESMLREWRTGREIRDDAPGNRPVDRES